MGPYSYSKHIGTQGAILALVCCRLLYGLKLGPIRGRKGSTRHNRYSWKWAQCRDYSRKQQDSTGYTLWGYMRLLG